MSHSSSPTNRNSIFGWVKTLKRGNLLSNDSVNEITSDNEIQSTDSRSPSKSVSHGHHHGHGHHHTHATPPEPIPLLQSLSQQDFLRPFLNHKLRSSNNVNRVRSNSLSQSDKSTTLRQHRDSFLQHNPLVDGNSKYFGVPLEDAIREASAKILILNPNPTDPGLSYGEIPIVVAKCGVFLKNNGLTVEGIFRVGGSSKRLKELQVIFNTPPDYGKRLNWDGYNVHDAASILRRYLNALPEPLIPLELYEAFRDPLRQKARIINYMKYKAENPSKRLRTKESKDDDLQLTQEDSHSPPQSQQNPQLTPVPDTPADLLDSTDSHPLTEANIGRLNSDEYNSTSVAQRISSPSQTEERPSRATQQQADDAAAKKSAKKSKNYKKLTRDVHEAIDEYKLLVDELPMLSKQLLFYILDLLAMVQNHSDENLMSSRNLAAIFQPSILSHPNHDLDPVEYALSQIVVEFLIQYAYKLLPNQGTPPLSPTDEPTHEAIPPVEVPVKAVTSTATSTSTTPLESTNTLLNKPPQAPFKRQYSNSLPNHGNQEDLVGFRNAPKSLVVLDSDHEFEITDEDENDIISDLDEIRLGLQLNNGSSDVLVPRPDIVVSTPSSTSVAQQ